jgi:colicin import membrane protein
MAKVAPSRKRIPKAEVEKEFETLVREDERTRAAFNPKTEELDRLRNQEIRQTVEGISADGIVQKISGLGLEISRSLSELSGKLISEVERLTTVREAVTLEQKELERLHKIDIAATSLDNLLQQYSEQKEKLEDEINHQRATWEEEELTRTREQKETEDSLRKQRQREMEEYEYKKALERKKAQDKYDEEIRLLEKKDKEKQENLEKSWQQREAALKEREVEWTQLKKDVDDFPLRLRKEIDAAVNAALKNAQQGFEQQTTLLRKDSEAEKRIAELQIQSLKETVDRQAAEVAKLHAQLEEAKKQVQDIAVKAIEGASGAQALSQINKIAMEQAKTRVPQN